MTEFGSWIGSFTGSDDWRFVIIAFSTDSLRGAAGYSPADVGTQNQRD